MKKYEFFKTIMVFSMSFFLHLFKIFPIQNKKILFFPFNGHYYCNLKYIDEKIREKRLPVIIMWESTNDSDISYPIGVKYVKRNSIAMFYHFYTSSIIIFNSGLPRWLYKRNGQTFIETWHGGGAYKKIDSVFKNIQNKWELIRAEKAWQRVDYIVSSCEKFTKVFKEDTGIHATFLPIGMPRNDIFFDTNRMQYAVKSVRKKYRIQLEKGIVLYAPTFRDNSMKMDLDINKLLSSLQLRFKKSFILLVRSHPHLAKDIFAKANEQEELIDVSNYVDMQELLAATDILITDYSSCMWDFSLTGRPCFIYANDLNSYYKERNFHTPIDEWPFPLAENNEEMVRNIENFNPDIYKERIFEHHRALGSYENGTASEQMCRLIKAICYKNEKISGEK
ncbi:hypothetical protein DWZ54_04845 [Mitsuokella sp. AF33-22]|uniref:CDP-glycerol glycerophosphotransferase family protein n=1 Tax=Mitsuokella sp. AF33-22 TaxID=2292047 RepID=UPI000E4B813D|nr:CDP-glycerol glycerophosphotransferase family protein [Mitsuokella sp. AF33-22]RHM55807.1 hypothetical protein DWZ54_04845 [Mitsuokella sp. AF33-22]